MYDNINSFCALMETWKRIIFLFNYKSINLLTQIIEHISRGLTEIVPKISWFNDFCIDYTEK